MRILDNIKCSICGEFLIARDGEIKQASSYNDCLRQCENCNVGYSNARTNPTMIFKNFIDNVPLLLNSDLDFILSTSINLINRTSKKNKFAFSTSEDALTWSFFKYFVVKNRLNDLLKLLNIDSDESYFDIYLWGTNICSPIFDNEFYKEIIKTSDSFKEDSTRRTEPDVILKLREKLIFIEVKYLSPNDVTTKKSKFNKYLIPNIDINKVIESGHYELYRNWAFASKLSRGGKFELINLGLQKIFQDKNCVKLSQFEASLNSNNGRFVKLSWEQIISKLNESNNEYDSWFLKYLNKKINVNR